MEKFMSKYKSKVFRVIKKYKLVVDGDKIFVCLSGGKDSGSAAYLLKKYIEEKKQGNKQK